MLLYFCVWWSVFCWFSVCRFSLVLEKVYLLFIVLLLDLVSIFSVRARAMRLARKNISDVTYLVSSRSSNCNSINLWHHYELLVLWKTCFHTWYNMCCAYLRDVSVKAESPASIPTKFCLTIVMSKYTSWVVHWGWSLLSIIALFIFGLVW